MDSVFVGLEQTAFAAAMRTSYFLYPLANVIHVLAALCFFAAVAAMDIKVLRATETGDARAFMAKVRPWAGLFLLLQIVSGVMLFAPEASHIFANPVYRLKLVVILVGLANVALLEVLVRRGELISAGVRRSAGLSLALWLSVAALGRLIAYF